MNKLSAPITSHQIDKTVYALGDSLTWGFPFGPDASWLAIVKNQLEIRAVNHGLNGDTTHGMNNRLEKIIKQVSPGAIVIITGGTNDAIAWVAPDSVLANYRQMITRVAVAQCLPVVGLTCPISEEPFLSRLLEYRQLLQAFTQKEKLPTIDFFPALAGSDGCSLNPRFAVDDWHPNEAGYRQMARVALPVLRRFIIPKS
ncbi:MAG: GDSL-type esterase/lipase family protein [Heliobacteriaceae bacterium]|nr:GDSL-type esterase/lipase family protein [Heliobacteriaceae bacterium]